MLERQKWTNQKNWDEDEERILRERKETERERKKKDNRFERRRRESLMTYDAKLIDTEVRSNGR